MKIRLYVHQGEAQLTLSNSKSKKRAQTRLKAQRTEPMAELASPERSNRSQVHTSNSQHILRKERSLTKRSCSHKKKEPTGSQIESEYYKCMHRDADDLKRQNDKLLKENIILNEYFRYFEKKHRTKENQRTEKAFSFRNIANQGIKGLFFGEENRAGISETKSSSKFKMYGV